jgi:hypothetical protein
MEKQMHKTFVYYPPTSPLIYIKKGIKSKFNEGWILVKIQVIDGKD